MNIRAIFHYIGHILRIEALLFLPSIGIAVFRRDTSSAYAFLIAFVVTLVAGQCLLFAKPHDRSIHAKESFVIVTLGWIALSIFGCLPFIISGYIPSFVDALFETISGFTTTGSTILTDVEALPYSLLFWRSFTHWIGGMGVLVFMLAIVPQSKGSGDSLHIMRAESPGPQVGKLVPKLRFTARILYAIYLVLTVTEVIMLCAGGMSLFDSLIHSFGSAGTGGFSNMNLSVGHYNNPYFDIVIGVFMMLFGVNFTIYYRILCGNFKDVWKDEELRLYLGIMLGSSLLISLNIMPLFDNNFATAFRHGFFQVSTIMTTTGYSSTDFNLWPEFSRMMLLGLMIVGASAGSTGGGMKVVRVLMLGKSIRGTLQRLLHPNSVKVMRMNGQRVEDGVMHSVYSFLVCYIGVAAVSMLIVSLDNFDTTTTVSAVISCLNNVGPGLNAVGPMENFSSLSALSKLVLSLDMLLGRLEIFPIIMLFSPGLWKRI